MRDRDKIDLLSAIFAAIQALLVMFIGIAALVAFLTNSVSTLVVCLIIFVVLAALTIIAMSLLERT